MTTEPHTTTQLALARQVHSGCLVCGAGDPLGLHLQFIPAQDGSMSVIFPGESRFQGYANRLHGGIIALLFDAAMTHCLLARELAGVTAELKVRYQFPVAAGRAVIVRAWVEKQKSRLYLVQGTLHQDGEVKSTAQAKFWLDPMAADVRGM